MKKYLSIAFLLLMAASSNLQAQTSPTNEKIKAAIQKYQAVGLTVAVVDKGELIFNESYGWKDKESNELLKNSDLFRIASISKSFSSTAIMQLIAQRKCNLEDDISDLIGFRVRNPKFPHQKISLKMLLSHTSSINDVNGYFDLDVINPTESAKFAQSYNDYQPGTQYEYCNLNFNMIGAVIERLSGERFDNYIKNHILNPLDLAAGYCVDSLDQSKFVTLYEYDRQNKTFNASPAAYNPRSEEIKNYTLGYTTPIFSPTGGMKISGTDLAKYMLMHMNYGQTKKGPIIQKKYAKIMQTPVALEEGYGLALTTKKNILPNISLIGHTGSAYGLYSMMFFDPKEKFGFVLITNGYAHVADLDFNPLLKECTNILYNDLILKK